MDYCKHYDMKKELNKYIDECMELRESNAGDYARYIHGGVIPRLD